MMEKYSRRGFIARSALASAGLGVAGGRAHAADAEIKQTVAGAKGSLPMGKIGKVTLSRLIAGGNLLSGWCHQRDLLFVHRLAAAYLTERKQFDTVQLFEELGVNCMVIDMMQLDIVNKYKAQRGGKMQTVVSVRQGWGDWDRPNWTDLKNQIDLAMKKGPDLVFLHGGYADRLVQSGKPERIELIGRALEYLRERGFAAGLGAHALEVLTACDEQKIEPDYYVKTFHHDRYWSATPKERRKPFSVDGPRQLDHNEFHDNIFCLAPEATAEYMAEKTRPWIAFKVLAAGAIPPLSGFKYAFENGADFIAVGMFDFEAEEDAQAVKTVLNGLKRERPWYGGELEGEA